MNINLTYDELMQIINQALGDSDFELVSYFKDDENDLNTTRIRLYSKEMHEKILINFYDYHIDVICNDVEIIEKLQRTYLDYISKKYPEVGEKKAKVEKIASEIAEKIKTTLINNMYNQGIKRIDEMLKQHSNLSLADALDFARCGNHTAFVKIDNPYFQRNRDIKIGDVYMANLDPVVDAEYGGIRSVIVVGYDNDKRNYICVPCTSNKDGGLDINYVTDTKIYAVTDKVRAISSVRLMQYKGNVGKETIQLLKTEVKKSYALFEEKEMYGNFYSNISYSQTVDRSKTLDQLVLLYPITKPSRQVIVDVTKKYVPYLEEKGFKFAKKDGELLYRTNSNFKSNVIITLNPQSFIEHSLPAINYDFSIYHIKRKEIKTHRWRYDRDFTEFYQRYMLEHNPCYYIHLIKYLCDIQRMFYRKQIFLSVFEDEEYIETMSKSLRDNFERLGIDYQGDFGKLITKGSKGFDLNLLREIPQVQEDETLDDDEKE